MLLISNMAMKEHAVITMYVEIRMVPSPTNGVTIPPNKKPAAPTIADAQPILDFPSVIASVVEDVNTIPTENSIIKTSISYPQKPNPRL